MWSRPDSTAWTVACAERAAVLVDMQSYFRAARSAMEKAERSIHLLGWAFDPDARFDPDDHGSGPARDRIGAFLKHLACNKPHLDVRLLVWKSALPVAQRRARFRREGAEACAGSMVMHGRPRCRAGSGRRSGWPRLATSARRAHAR